jgi:hypothetical protein
MKRNTSLAVLLVAFGVGLHLRHGLIPEAKDICNI